ncbi:MAG: glycosyltransferase family 9 protein [Alphaproteobacteria bacterium]|nr:glycosyltransferase family 9 protein [Alphaproteobacteria bacterium]MBU1526085.1 glycosyltransferase family 9 protein [Alphaproteobacteria bacterium]MBU2350602.1 glycosyltransferase family 9 protein [Alphaproteobacteria bacterium]MBU2382258.1 glycosyltransferase family 9 protein [Alphaproteobacteria bacterium]
MPAPQVLFVTSNRIGDCVISSGVIREIGRQLPGAEITVACGRPPAPLFRAAPGVVEVIPWDKKPLSGHWFALWNRARSTRWDLVIDVRGSALAWGLNAKRRVVYSRRLETGRRKVETATAMMGATEPLHPEIFLDDRARAEAAAVIDPQLAGGAGHGPILALAPIAHQPGKSWPADRWGALVEKLKAEPRFDGWRFMPVGGPGDRPPATPALEAAGPRGIDFVGKGDILASAAAIDRAALFVGNDSGLMHVAAAAGRPTLGLFGPTEWWLYGPWGPRTRTVASNEVRGQFAPIEDLTVDRVFSAVIDLHDAFPRA